MNNDDFFLVQNRYQLFLLRNNFVYLYRLKSETMNSGIDSMHYIVLHMGKALCHTEWNYKKVCSPFTRIYYITKGHARIYLPDGVQELRPHHLYIIPAFMPHDCFCENEFEHYYIHIYNESTHDILNDWILPIEVAADDQIHLFERLMSLFPNLGLTQSNPQIYDNMSNLYENVRKNKQRDLCARIEARGIIYQILTAFIAKSKPKKFIQDIRIERAINYIHTHINSKIDINELASNSCLSKDHFIRMFKKEMKTTPLDYINKKKIEKAKLLLLTEKKQIKEVSYLLGFEDQTYFNRLFRKYTGTTPKDYRRTSEGILG